MEEIDTNNLGDIEGFRIGEYFVTFPPGEFVKEDEDGHMYVLVDIYKINKDNKATRMQNEHISDELHEQINEQINKFLVAKLDDLKKGDDI